MYRTLSALPLPFPLYLFVLLYLLVFITAISGSFGACIACILSGTLMKVLKMQEVGAARMFNLAMFLAIVGVAVLMSLGCPQRSLAGNFDVGTQR